MVFARMAGRSPAGIDHPFLFLPEVQHGVLDQPVERADGVGLGRAGELAEQPDEFAVRLIHRLHADQQTVIPVQ